MKLMRNVYADNAATTRVSETALQAMLPYLRETYGNPPASTLPARRRRLAWPRPGKSWPGA